MISLIGKALDYARARGSIALRQLTSDYGTSTLSWGTIFAAIVLMAAYWRFPHVFNHFFQWLLNSFFDVLHDAFGGEESKDVVGPGKNKGNHTEAPTITTPSD